MMAQRGGAPEFSGEMIGWVLRGFSVGSHGFSWVLSGFSWVLMGSQGVLSGYSDCAFLGSQVVLRQAPSLCGGGFRVHGGQAACVAHTFIFHRYRSFRKIKLRFCGAEVEQALQK